MLSCTRRCLSCGHIFCQPRQGQEIIENQETRAIDPNAPLSPRLRRQAKNRARSKKHTPCASEFDFQGWAAWGSWRRLTLLRRRHQELGTRFSKKEMEAAALPTWNLRECYRHDIKFFKRWLPKSSDKEEIILQRKRELYLSGKHDCSVHCDSPSECVHAVKEAKRTGLLERIKASMTVQEAWPVEFEGGDKRFRYVVDPDAKRGNDEDKQVTTNSKQGGRRATTPLFTIFE